MIFPKQLRSGVESNRPCAPAGPKAKSGHHLVADKQGSVVPAELFQQFIIAGAGQVETRRWRGHPRQSLPRYRDLSSRRCLPDASGSLKEQDVGKLREGGGDSRAVGLPSVNARTGSDEQGIRVPMVTSSNFTIRSRRVNPRASRIAVMRASVPELQKRRRSSPGTACFTRCARAISPHAGLKLVPRSAAARTA